MTHRRLDIPAEYGYIVERNPFPGFAMACNAVSFNPLIEEKPVKDTFKGKPGLALRARLEDFLEERQQPL